MATIAECTVCGSSVRRSSGEKVCCPRCGSIIESTDQSGADRTSKADSEEVRELYHALEEITREEEKTRERKKDIVADFNDKLKIIAREKETILARLDAMR